MAATLNINGSAYQCRPDRNGVLLLDNGDPIAYAKRATRGEHAFLVTAYNCNGRTRYMFGLADRTLRALGLEGASYGAECALAERITGAGQ